MARITGIGGVFFKSKGDGAALAAWYGKHLGLQLEDFGVGGPQLSLIWTDEFGAQCVFATEAFIPAATWKQVAVAFEANGTPAHFTIDGASAPFSQLSACTGTLQSTPIDVALGARWAGVPNVAFALAGGLDEVRIENTLRTPGWLHAQFLSQSGGWLVPGNVEQRP